MTQHRKLPEGRKPKLPPQPPGKRNWIIHLIDKVFDSIIAAGPVAWVSIVAIVAILGMVLALYIISGGPHTH
jgi:hypothetical protein